jgi:hypothetical protein
VIYKAQSPESNSFFGEIALILILTISFFNSTLLSPLFFLMSMLLLFGSRYAPPKGLEHNDILEVAAASNHG